MGFSSFLITQLFHINISSISFLCPRIEWSGAYCFCPVCLFVCMSVCLSVVNFHIRYNSWTVRGRDFIFGMHAPLMMPFQMTPRSMTFALKIAFLDFVAAGVIVSVSQTHLDFLTLYILKCQLTVKNTCILVSSITQNFVVSGRVGIPLTGLTTPVGWLSLWWRFCVVWLRFRFFCGCKGFCHRTESDIFLFLLFGAPVRTPGV